MNDDATKMRSEFEGNPTKCPLLELLFAKADREPLAKEDPDYVQPIRMPAMFVAGDSK